MLGILASIRIDGGRYRPETYRRVALTWQPSKLRRGQRQSTRLLGARWELDERVGGELIAQEELLDLAAAGVREVVGDEPLGRDLVAGEPVAAPAAQLVDGRRRC